MLIMNDNYLTNSNVSPSLALSIVLGPEVAAHAELPGNGHVELEHAPAAPALRCVSCQNISL